jgi:hypothetical protein
MEMLNWYSRCLPSGQQAALNSLFTVGSTLLDSGSASWSSDCNRDAAGGAEYPPRAGIFQPGSLGSDSHPSTMKTSGIALIRSSLCRNAFSSDFRGTRRRLPKASVRTNQNQKAICRSKNSSCRLPLFSIKISSEGLPDQHGKKIPKKRFGILSNPMKYNLFCALIFHIQTIPDE